MAFYAELKRRKWYCVCTFNWINEYKKELYNKWYSSLTEEQKIALEEQKKRREEERRRELNTSLAKIALMTGMISGLYRKTNTYNGVYDENGFPLY